MGMVTKKITSLQHPLVKHWVKLRTDKAYREETQRVLVSGKKMVKELPVEVLITVNGEGEHEVTEEIMKKITGLEQPDGFAAEVKLPAPQNVREMEYVVVLDRIADPGNLGTLVRTALALGWDGVIMTPGTVDLFNDKALRAAKGATFRLPYAQMSHEEIAKLKHHFYTADVQGKPVEAMQFKAPLALILSNESQGAQAWSDSLGEKITIPMKGQMESLNVAISGAILLYAMRYL